MQDPSPSSRWQHNKVDSCKRWVRKDDGDILDAKRSGRPTKLTPDTKREITKLTKETGTGLRTVARKLNFSDDFKERGKTVGVTAIGNFVRSTEWEKTAYKVRVKPICLRRISGICLRFVRE